MAVELHPESDRERFLLEEIEQDPDITQANLAAQLGVAVGTVNWHLKRLISKGYIKVKRAQRRKLRYIITPEGLAFRAMLTVNYIETSLRLYRNTRLRVRELVAQLRQAGFDQVFIETHSDPAQVSGTDGGMADIADICRLTCLEQGVQVLANLPEPAQTGMHPIQRAPVLEIRGSKVQLRMEGMKNMP
jgi:DNA-binding MarR family transcriptional regulator